MTLRDLLYLVRVADLGHFGRAAAAVNVAQPTLSGQIRKLEESLGIALFERDSRNVRLTPAGAAIAGEARAALDHAAAIGDIAAAHRDPLAGRFRLGIIASLGPFIAPDLLAEVRRRAPRLELFLHEGLTDELVASVRARTLDAAVIATAPGGGDLLDIATFDEPFLIGHAPDHPLAAVAAPTLGDVERETLLLLADGHCLRDQALALCGADSVDLRVEASSLITVMRLAALGRGTTLVPALAARFAEGLMLRPLAGGEASRRVRLAARRTFPRTAALEVVAAAAGAIATVHGLPVVGAAAGMIGSPASAEPRGKPME